MFFCFSSLARRHMMEIQALQTRQKEEIEALFIQMGKQPPPSVFSPAVAMAGGRRRRKSHKSARSSGQPSPIHSGKHSELAFCVFFGSQDKFKTHIDLKTTILLNCSWINIYMPLCIALVCSAGSPASAQSHHGPESNPKQSSPSATETAAEASQAASRSSIQPLRPSPSMPSLSSCATGKCKLLPQLATWINSLSFFSSLHLTIFLFPRIERDQLHKWFRPLPDPADRTHSSCFSHPEGQGHLHRWPAQTGG